MIGMFDATLHSRGSQLRKVALLLIVFIVNPQVFGIAAGAIGVAAETGGDSFRIRYTATITNIDSVMDRVVVYLPVPRDWDSQRSVQIESITPKPFAINEDPNYGDRMAYFLLANGIPRKQSREFTIEYTFQFYETHIQVDPARVGPYNMSDPAYTKYTKQRPAEQVESDDPAIRKAASDIVGTETNPYVKARLIYNWLVANMQYKFPSPWGAKEAYLKRAGDCGKYTALFCAMAISQNIPCRAASGLTFGSPFPRAYSDKGQPSDPSAYGSHVYAEFYLPDYGWIPVDGSRGRSSGKPDAYFGHASDPFLTNSKGFGIRLVPSVKGMENPWLFQHYQWWFWGDARNYDSYYTYSVEKITPTVATTEATTSVAGSSTLLVSTTLSSLTEPVAASTAEATPATTTLPVQASWLQAGWPYLVVAAAVVAVVVSLVMQKRRHAS